MTNNIKATIEFLIELIGIDAKSEIVYARMTQKLGELGDNLTRFLHYCEKYHDHEDVRYLSGYGRFNALHKRFVAGMQTIEQKAHLGEHEVKAKAIVDKLKAIKQPFEREAIKGRKLGFANFRNPIDNAPFFSDDEVRIIVACFRTLGGAIVHVSDFGREAAQEKIVDHLCKPKRKALSQSPKVAQLIGNASEAASA